MKGIIFAETLYRMNMELLESAHENIIEKFGPLALVVSVEKANLLKETIDSYFEQYLAYAKARLTELKVDVKIEEIENPLLKGSPLAILDPTPEIPELLKNFPPSFWEWYDKHKKEFVN